MDSIKVLLFPESLPWFLTHFFLLPALTWISAISLHVPEVPTQVVHVYHGVVGSFQNSSRWPCRLVFTVVIPTPECKLHLLNGFEQTQYGQNDGMLLLSLKNKNRPSLWLFLLAQSKKSHLPHCELLYAEAHTTRKWGKPLTNSQQETGALRQIAHEKLNTAKNHVSELGNGFFSSQAFTWDFLATLWETHSQKTQLSCSQILTHSKCEIINVCYLCHSVWG